MCRILAMDISKRLAKLLAELDPMKLKSPSETEYSSEATQLAKDMQYVRSTEKLIMVLYGIFSKSFSPKEATIDWKPIVNAILKDEELKRHFGRLT